MKKTLKILAFSLAIIMLFALLCGCAQKRKEGYPAVFTSDDRVVMKLGGYNVAYDFYRFMFNNSIDFFDNGDDSYWTQEGNDVEKVKEYVLESLLETYGMFALADKYEITLSEADLLEIETEVKNAKSGMTNDEFAKEIATAYMTEELYSFLLKTQKLEYLVYSHITDEASGIIKIDDATLEKEIETNFARASHILFTFNNESEKQSQKELAEQVLERLKNGEDFETLKEEYSDDTDLKGNTDGYYFTHGEFKNAFEYAAFELNEGEISEVVTTNVGFHIVKRLPIEDEYVNENFETLRQQCITAKYYDLLKESYKDFKAEYTEEYKKMKLDSFAAE